MGKNKEIEKNGKNLVDLNADYKPDRNQRRRLNKAIENLSKTEIGKFLLERGEALDYKLRYEKDLKSLAICHADPKIICFRPDLKIHQLTILLVHELAHAVQFHDLKMPEIKRHPNLIVMREHAMEADSRAHESLFVLEFAFAARNKTQFRHILNQSEEYTPHIANACIRKVIEAGRFNDAIKHEIMRTAFEMYYSEKNLRSIYDADAIKEQDWNDIDVNDLKEFRLSNAFNRTAKRLAKKFRYKDKPYLSKMEGHRSIDLTGARYMGLTEGAFKKTKELIANGNIDEWVLRYHPLPADNVKAPEYDEHTFLKLKNVIKEYKVHEKRQAALQLAGM